MLETRKHAPTDFTTLVAYESELSMAIRGKRGSFDNFKDHIPWRSIGWGDFLANVIDMTNHGPEEAREVGANGMAALIDFAIAQGESAILQARGYEARIGAFDVLRYPEPLASIILGEYEQLLRRYLDNGFDPSAEHRYTDGSCTALQFAEKGGSEDALAMMRAHMSRNRIEAVLAGASSANLAPGI